MADASTPATRRPRCWYLLRKSPCREAGMHCRGGGHSRILTPTPPPNSPPRDSFGPPRRAAQSSPALFCILLHLQDIVSLTRRMAPADFAVPHTTQDSKMPM